MGEYLLLQNGTTAATPDPGEVELTGVFWAPRSALPGAADWLALPRPGGALDVAAFPSGEACRVLPPGSLGQNGDAPVLWSAGGRLAWSPSQAHLAQTENWAQALSVRPVTASTVITWPLSADIRETYYQLVDWVPGTSLILAARGMLAASLWSWGVPLVTINADTGKITELGVSMLLTTEAYAWQPGRPGRLAVATGASRYLYEYGHLALIDVTTGQVRYLAGEVMATFEPAWSPDGKLLAYSAGPAVPEAEGDGAALEHTLDGRAIYIVDPTTGQSRQLTRPPSGAVDAWPRWSADSRHLLYTRQQAGATEVRQITLDGDEDEPLVGGLADPWCYYGGCNWGQMVVYTN